MYKANFSYTKHTISKKNGKIRQIFVPNENLKLFLKDFLENLESIYLKKHLYDCDHAFLKGKNCVTNAMSHIKNRFVLSLDIENFFESIPKKLLEKHLPSHVLDLILVNNKIVQGYPTSPYLANIAMIEIDTLIMELIKNQDITYTRYADDLTFSFNEVTKKDYILANTIKILKAYNLKINSKKTKLQDKKNGRAIITGIGVSMYAVHPTRKTVKKIRAAQHQQNNLSERGLISWSLCRVPKQSDEITNLHLT